MAALQELWEAVRRSEVQELLFAESTAQVRPQSPVLLATPTPLNLPAQLAFKADHDAARFVVWSASTELRAAADSVKEISVEVGACCRDTCAFQNVSSHVSTWKCR